MTSLPSTPTSARELRQRIENPAQMIEILQRHLLPARGQTYQIRDCQVANMRFRDGSRGTVQYDLFLENVATGESWSQMVTGLVNDGARSRRVWEALRNTPAEPAVSGGRPALAPFSYVSELDMLVQVFPHDFRLPGIARLLTGPPPELETPILATFGPEERTVLDWDAEVVRYRVDMRATIRLRVRAAVTATGQVDERQFYAKIYRDAEHELRAYRTQRDLHKRTAAAQAPFTVAKPIVRATELRAVVTEGLAGVSLKSIVRREDDDRLPALRASARAVAAFHTLEIDVPTRDFSDDVARLNEAQGLLHAARPDLSPMVAEMKDTVISGLHGAPSLLIHGDLKPEHLLLDGDRVALIDFDLMATADPVIDVAHLLAFLGQPHEQSRSPRDQIEIAARTFREEYFAHVPTAWRARLPLYHAMTSIHKAAGLCRRRGGAGQERVEDVLREGQTLMEDDGDTALPSFRRRITRPGTRSR